MALTIAAMAIGLYVVAIVIGKLDTLNTGLTGNALAGFNNVSQYTWIGITLGAIGILVYAGMSILGYFGMQRR